MFLNYGLVAEVLLAAGLAIPTLVLVRGMIKLRNGDSTLWERQIRKFEAEDRIGLNTGAIVFTGSSTIRFWKSLQSDMSPLQVLNRGFGGAQIHDVTHYADRILVPTRPRAIVFYAGENDMAGMLFTAALTDDEGKPMRDVFRWTAFTSTPVGTRFSRPQ